MIPVPTYMRMEPVPYRNSKRLREYRYLGTYLLELGTVQICCFLTEEVKSLGRYRYLPNCAGNRYHTEIVNVYVNTGTYVPTYLSLVRYKFVVF